MAKKRTVYNKAPESVSDKVYRIQLESTSQDLEEAKREFNKIYAAIAYQKKHYYPDLAILMCLSKNDPYTASPINVNEGKRGRPKRDYQQNKRVRGNVKHETDLHMHIYIAGRGSSMVAQQLREKYGAEQHTDNPYMPYAYVKRQALRGCFRAVDCAPFINKDQYYEMFEWREKNQFKPKSRKKADSN